MQSLPLKTVKDLAAEVGLTVVGVTGADELTGDRHFLEQWQAKGHAGNMEYMLRSPQLLAGPAVLVPGARSVVTVGVFYDRVPRLELRPGFGRVARYAWGRDYHKVLRRRLESFLELVRKAVGRPFHSKVFSDSVPVLERAIAARAGVGFIGKNTMMIIAGQGSFSLLGEVLWDLEVSQRDNTSSPAPAAHCGSCSRCLSRCPTQAFVGERELNASRCISYLTIEKRGALTWQEREWLGEWVFGCDVCQDVCPFNIVPLRRAERAQLPELSEEQGVGQSLSLGAVLQLRDDESFQSRFAGTALMRAKREGLLRNAAVVAANTAAFDVLPLLKEVAERDSSPVVRQHAVWAYASLAVKSAEINPSTLKDVLSRFRKDPATEVSAEVTELLSRLPN